MALSIFGSVSIYPYAYIFEKWFKYIPSVFYSFIIFYLNFYQGTIEKYNIKSLLDKLYQSNLDISIIENQRAACGIKHINK